MRVIASVTPATLAPYSDELVGVAAESICN